MGLTLQEQLSSLPIPRLTTVLRVNFDLPEGHASYESATRKIEGWWNKKAEPYQIQISQSTPDLSFIQGGFKLEFARSDEGFALAMEEPDSSVDGRFWIWDFALKLNGNRPQFAIRGSFRQPHNISIKPEPRAPKFLRDVVDQVGAVDCWPMQSKAQLVDPENLPFLTDLVLSGERTLPVIVISEDDRTGQVFVNTDLLAKLLSGTAHIFRIDAQSSWQLSREWGKDWSTFQGAIRCYNPGFSRNDDKFRHRLWLPDAIQRMDAAAKNGFANNCVGHVFTQVTAQFEPWPLLSPSLIRRQLEKASKKTAQPRIAPSFLESDLGEKPALLFEVSDFVVDEPAAAPLAIAEPLQGFVELNAELLSKLEREKENVRVLEEALQQERAQHAELAKTYSETKDYVVVVEEEMQNLVEQKTIALGDISSEQSEALKPLWRSYHGFLSSLQNMASQFRRYEQDSKKTDQLQQEISTARQEIVKLKAQRDSVNRRQVTKPDANPALDIFQRSFIVERLPQLAQKNPSLKVILEFIARLFPERVAVLESAFTSAERSDAFLHGKKALELLLSLATEYWQSIQDGSGDAEARKVFGNSYAPKESEQISKAGQVRRTFDYQGNSIYMTKHLKIGVGENPADTLRIHFEWIAEEKLIVIGHCGKHLDFN